MADAVLISVRLPSALLGRIEGNRSEFIRGAVEAALGKPVVEAADSPAPAEKKVEAPKPVTDQSAVLSALSGGGLSARRLADDLGWTELRVDRVCQKLSAAGLVRFERGQVVLA